MHSRTLQILCLSLLLKHSHCSICEEKCSEYSGRFLNQRISISRPGGASDIGKVEADIGEFPHMVVLGFPKKGHVEEITWGFCGGSLISDRFVLTGAICTGTVTRGVLPVKRARIGVQDLEKHNENLQEFNITEMFIHPGPIEKESYNDIALLKLDRPVEFSRYARPACLYNSFHLPLGLEVSVVGFGLPDSSTSVFSSTLKKVYLDLFTQPECSRVFERSRQLPHGILDKLMVCAGGRKVPRNICKGDYGSPLQIFNKDDNIYEIVGITSLGNAKCGSTGPSGVYTRVAAYVPWIESIVWPCDDLEQTADELNSYIESAGTPPERPSCPKIIRV